MNMEISRPINLAYLAGLKTFRTQTDTQTDRQSDSENEVLQLGMDLCGVNTEVRELC